MKEAHASASTAVSDWQKGGLRYAKLKEIVPEYLSPAEVLAFFVAVTSAGGSTRLINPLSPLQREYVLAATTSGLAIPRSIVKTQNEWRSWSVESRTQARAEGPSILKGY